MTCPMLMMVMPICYVVISRLHPHVVANTEHSITEYYDVYGTRTTYSLQLCVYPSYTNTSATGDKRYSHDAAAAVRYSCCNSQVMQAWERKPSRKGSPTNDDVRKLKAQINLRRNQKLFSASAGSAIIYQKVILKRA